jgi:hypothetical protein
MIQMKAVCPTTLKMTRDVVTAVADVDLGVEPVMAEAIVEAVALAVAMKLVTAVAVVVVAMHLGRVLKDLCTTRPVMLRVTMIPLI